MDPKEEGEIPVLDNCLGGKEGLRSLVSKNLLSKALMGA
jgi:hypothetical protein